MDYRQLNLKVDTELYYQLASYAEKERRSVNNSVEYILQRFFEDNPVKYMEGGNNAD